MARPSDSIELEALFEDTLAEATQTRDFGKMIEKLTPEACHPKAVVEPMSWRYVTLLRFCALGEEISISVSEFGLTLTDQWGQHFKRSVYLRIRCFLPRH